MSEVYTPAGSVGTSLKRATVAEAATGTHGSEFMRDNISAIADKIRYLADDGTFKSMAAVFPIGTAVVAGAVAGEAVLPNNRALRSVNAAGTNTNPLISLQGSDEIQIGSGGQLHVKIGSAAMAAMDAGAAGRDRTLIFDTTNNRLIYYIGGARFHLTGVAV